MSAPEARWVPLAGLIAGHAVSLTGNMLTLIALPMYVLAPWVLVGEQRGRGPDDEPLVACHRAVAWVSDPALRECEAAVEAQDCAEWGPLNRAW